MGRTSTATTAALSRGPLNALIATRMRQLGLSTVKEFAEYAGVGRTSLHDLVRGRAKDDGAWTKPSFDTLTKLAAALNKPTHELVYLIDPDAPGAGTVVGVQQVPVYIAGCVGAGPEQLVEADDVVYVEKQFADGRDLVAFHVCGDSMAGGRHPIYDGDIVVVDRQVAGEVNFPVVARLRGDGYVCKRLRPGGILDSTNPEYDDPDMSIIAPARVAHVEGRVVRVISNALAA